MKTVHVVGGFRSYEVMFERHGWFCVDQVEDADLVQFCGGEDVWPGFYTNKIHPLSQYDIERDDYEKKIYDLALMNRCAIAGVCRGAQFVHVMNGGNLFQHVDGHAMKGEHLATVIHPQELVSEFDHGNIFVSSTHHQMMDDNAGEVVMAAWESSTKEDGIGHVVDSSAYAWDVEAIWHPVTRSFCYQPHPEYHVQKHACQIFYFKALKRLLFPKVEEPLMLEAS